ncbi:hypothetical protein [Shimwellia blattae]|uniref:protein YnhH n=1 Tax=Shimwellia blattae TaxID=563 RepID=UPI003B438A6C
MAACLNLNGFSILIRRVQHTESALPRLAEPQAHFILHAFFLSPILRRVANRFRTTLLHSVGCCTGHRENVSESSST